MSADQSPYGGSGGPEVVPGLPVEVVQGPPRILLDRARLDDVAAIVALLRDDPVGEGREDVDDLEPYLEAFRDVDADPRQLLVVARARGDLVVGTMQLTLMRSLSRRGATRLQVEAVRVGLAARGSGLGRAMLTWAADFGRTAGAELAQLTTDRRRPDAHRFYERLGWVDSHKGLKLDLRGPG